MTAVIANRDRLDGIEAIVQPPGWHEEELAYLKREQARGL